MKLRVLKEAELEIESARVWLNRRASDLGSRFLEDLSATFAAIQDRPQSFSRLETMPDNWPYRRALLRTFRYAVIFEELDDEILIVAVAHAGREPNYWLDRT